MKASLARTATQNISFSVQGDGFDSSTISVPKTSTQKVSISTQNGTLQSSTPVTLKNQINEIHSIQDIQDVSSLDVEQGATLIYNSVTDKYEIRKLQTADLPNISILNLDGGSF